MRTELAVYTGLVVAGLAGAFWASLPVEEGEEEKVTVFSLEPKQVSEITLSTRDTEVTATQRGADGRFWIQWTKKEMVEASKAGPHDAATSTATDASVDQKPKVETKVLSERFLANEKLDVLTSAFGPLKAVRVFPKVDAKQLADFGLDQTPDRFTIKAGSQSLTLLLGKKSYGSNNRFVFESDGSGKAAVGGRVLLVEDRGFENLERANLRLYDRRLLSFEIDDVQKAQVQAAGKTKRLSHTQRDKSGELAWSEDEDGAEIKPGLGIWMDKLAKLRLQNYADDAQIAAMASAAPIMEVSFEKDGKVLDTLSIYKVKGTVVDYFAKSRFLDTPVKLVAARVEPIEKDLATVLTGAGVPAADQAAPASAPAPHSSPAPQGAMPDFAPAANPKP